ncbi:MULTISPECIES: LptF/LptG family permease [Sphingobacterium]|uniref:Membrane protein n=1 Tax=Sphingobacterium cellulitidis TaxID=1768011 RepID=A0A8H9KSX3_9SPHI|nr:MULTISPECIES: LptF/LptG family permease [Sphingobacterium]MBA8985584.1 lipopolysaccharide export system permease protein [Sphingobacterium soli]OYD43928.1 permease [Sphingobacterium cellulitidis]OYD47187.1 permease [Sphingobacterium cellulitidis]WFB64002.1 LptF/LptG family permease [Sphingobacterium sp. WM]GGE08440.1 membrane protein [Sphingobacterium soli]
MFKIIDRYIMKKYLSTFVFTVAIFCVVIVIFDISEKIDDFNKYGATMTQVFFEYYALGSLPFFINMLTPLFNFIAVIFFTSKMADQTEIVPILSGGMSFNRLLRPYMICAALIFGMTLLSNVYIIPFTNKVKVNFENVYVKPNKVSTTSSSIHMQVDSNTYVYMGSFDTKSKVGYNFSLEKFDGDKMMEKLMAERVTWDSVARKWSLHTYTTREIKGLKEEMLSGEKKDTTLDMRPQDFESYEDVFTTMDQHELNERISKEEVRGTGMMNELLLEKYKRIINPFSAFILTLIGVSLSSKKVRGGIGLSLGLGIGLSCIYIVLERFSSMFSIKGGLDPLISVLIPNVIFLILSFYLLKKAPK